MLRDVIPAVLLDGSVDDDPPHQPYRLLGRDGALEVGSILDELLHHAAHALELLRRC